MTKLVTILGGSGFVGRQIARQMAQAGWRVRVATRRPSQHPDVRTYGVVGQVEPVLCNIRNRDSVRSVVMGADAVVNCCGILAESGKNSFAAVQAEGPALVAEAARDLGVAHLVHVSAIGADVNSDSEYARTKGQGEAAVLAAFPNAVILRPSIIFGTGDAFFNRFAGMARLTPVLPIHGGATRFQPVHVEDVARAAVKAATGQAAPGIYELGGPEVATFRALIERTLAEIRRKRLILDMPGWMARGVARGLGVAQFLTGGLFTNSVLTLDQIRNLGRDNVVAPGAKGLADLGIDPVPLDLILPTYLWRFRPTGQFEAIKESSRGLRGQDQA